VRLLPLLVGPPAALAALAVTLAALDRGFAYHPPLAGDRPPPPRMEALADLEVFRRAKSEEEARRKELLSSLDTPKMVELGREIVHGRGLCFNCHRVGSEGRGTQGPDLAGVGARADTRVAGMSGVDYLTQSLYEPRAFVVEGYAPAMIPANRPPIGLNELDVLMVIAYLQSLGGMPTVTPETKLKR
jgi:hypothetical protein